MSAPHTRNRRSDVSLLVTLLLLGTAACEAEADSDSIQTRALVPAQGDCPAFATNAVCACNGTDLHSPCQVFTHETRFYMNLSLQPYSAFNDHVESFVVGPDAKVKFAEHPGGAGQYKIVYGSGANGYYVPSITVLNVAGFWPQLQGRISAIRVDNASDGQCQNPAAGQFAIFGDLNYNQGTNGDCVVLDPGSYPNHTGNPPSGASPTYSGGGFGLDNDSITSIKSGSNATITLFPEPNFMGSPYTSTVSDTDLRTPAPSYNDRTSSITLGP